MRQGRMALSEAGSLSKKSDPIAAGWLFEAFGAVSTETQEGRGPDAGPGKGDGEFLFFFFFQRFCGHS